MYYGFAGNKLITKDTSIIGVREDILNMMYGKWHVVCTITTDVAGKNVVETLKWVSADLDHQPSPFMTRKTGERKWRGVTADGEIFVPGKNGKNRYYERKR